MKVRLKESTVPEIVIVPALFGTICFVVWTVASNLQRSRHVREMTAFNARIIERMGSIKDFNDFLQTPGGTQFMNAITADKGPTGPRDRILRAVQTGIVLSSVAAGCLFLSRLYRYETSDIFTFIGVILLSLGVGFLIAAAAAYGLSQRLGVLQLPNRSGEVHELRS
jgi:hypothetical protein